MEQIKYSIIKLSTGLVLRSGLVSSENDIWCNDDERIIIGEQYSSGWIENDQFFPIPESPSNFSIFDDVSKQWIDPRTTEMLLDNVRVTRNRLLTDSDWTQIPNGPLTLEQQQAWATYRQELRDVTKQSGCPSNVIWPTKPE